MVGKASGCKTGAWLSEHVSGWIDSRMGPIRNATTAAMLINKGFRLKRILIARMLKTIDFRSGINSPPFQSGRRAWGQL